MQAELWALRRPEREHFGSEGAREQAATLGMWVFLATEVLLFASLLAGYAVYRLSFPGTFAEAKTHMEVAIGTTNTYVLVTSSVLVALGTAALRLGHRRRSVAALLGAIVLGFGFLSLKLVEYGRHIEQGALPGAWYHFEDFARPGAGLFFTLYYLLTGLHAFHVLVGIALLSVMAWRVRAGTLTREEHVPLELAGMYWHFVDVVWLFLWPLLYLA